MNIKVQNHVHVNEYGQLYTAVSQWVDLSEQQWQQFAAIFKLRQVDAREFIVLPGANQHEIIFVNEGLLRFYYIDEEGEEANKAFIGENEFAGPLASAALGLPLYFGIQALEPTQMLVAQYSDYVNLFEQDLVFERLGRKLTETLLVRNAQPVATTHREQLLISVLPFIPFLSNKIYFGQSGSLKNRYPLPG